eukprot:CAMPEP_0196736502 /NCGR_PEP_ID=MMETSP1091-20130531/14548_1 /TAXON_ID=302021 /ORGANISM="Rhodomonas sp., Strain CCMP768" /LENGTH=155 /DNA_ID=CAMNT_0042080249 /DNA_START=104 /DNA_END=572 /DNA_ORIENTATION=-
MIVQRMPPMRRTRCLCELDLCLLHQRTLSCWRRCTREATVSTAFIHGHEDQGSKERGRGLEGFTLELELHQKKLQTLDARGWSLGVGAPSHEHAASKAGGASHASACQTAKGTGREWDNGGISRWRDDGLEEAGDDGGEADDLNRRGGYGNCGSV